MNINNFAGLSRMCFPSSSPRSGAVMQGCTRLFLLFGQSLHDGDHIQPSSLGTLLCEARLGEPSLGILVFLIIFSFFLIVFLFFG